MWWYPMIYIVEQISETSQIDQRYAFTQTTSKINSEGFTENFFQRRSIIHSRIFNFKPMTNGSIVNFIVVMLEYKVCFEAFAPTWNFDNNSLLQKRQGQIR